MSPYAASWLHYRRLDVKCNLLIAYIFQAAHLLQRVSPLYSTFQPYICSATGPANSRVRSAAGISFHPLAFWPDQRGEKSLLPWLSAMARSGAIAEVARGNAGAPALIGPSSFMIWFTIPRAGRPVKMLVSAVWRAASLFRATR